MVIPTLISNISMNKYHVTSFCKSYGIWVFFAFLWSLFLLLIIYVFLVWWVAPHLVHFLSIRLINGEHCRKYVWCIHHQHHKNEPTTIILAVVNWTEGGADILTGEQLELNPEYLCMVKEVKKIQRHGHFVDERLACWILP